MTNERHDDHHESNTLVSHLLTPEATGEVPADSPRLWVERGLADG